MRSCSEENVPVSSWASSKYQMAKEVNLMANFSRADLRGADLGGAILVGANFDGAHVSSVEIDSADSTEVPQ